MAQKLPPPPPKSDGRFDDWVSALYRQFKGLLEPVKDAIQALTPTQATDLTDGGDSSLHYHAEDRKRSNHTGTQTSQTISDFESRVRSLSTGTDHSQLFSLAWTQSGHTGTATTIGGFNASGVAEYLTRSGTGTVVVMQEAPTINGATIAGNLTFSGTARRIIAEMSSNTLADRLIYQTSATNNSTLVGALPSGTGTVSRFVMWNSSDPDNSSEMTFGVTGTQVQIVSSLRGTGSYLPIVFQTGGATNRLYIDTSGNVGIGMTPARTLDVTGTFGVTGAATFGSTVTGGTYNKVTITAPAAGSTLTIADGKTLTCSNTLTFTGTDSSSVNFGAGGTVLYTNGGAITAEAFIPSGSTVPTNGMYLSAANTVALSTNSVVRLKINSSGAIFEQYIKSSQLNGATAGIGYATGAGSTVTQLTSKATSVALNCVCGTITMHNAALAANTTVSFTWNNATTLATDLIILNHVSGGTAGAYFLNAQAGAGAATINVRNITAGSLSEAIVIGFAVFRAVTA